MRRVLGAAKVAKVVDPKRDSSEPSKPSAVAEAAQEASPLS